MSSRNRRSGGFTLIELLVVIVIIAILASLILIGLATSRRKAQWTQCSSNLHELAIAFTDYLGQNSERTPPWLSSLYPEYSSAREVFVCPADAKRGKIDGSKPKDLIDMYETRFRTSTPPSADPVADAAAQAFDETDDNKGRNGIDACSYFYEFCAVKCSLGDAVGGETWAEYKRRELTTVANKSVFPAIRCFYHWKDRTYRVLCTESDGSKKEKEDGMTINSSIQGNVFFAPENWKATILQVYE